MEPTRIQTKHAAVTLEEIASFAPGMADVMVSLGSRFQAMYQACLEKNWKLALYQFLAIQKLFKIPEITRPKYATAMNEFFECYMNPILASIKAQNHYCPVK